MNGKMIGSIMLVMGTLIGGGVLALPMVDIGAGFFSVFILIVFMWLLMLATGLMFLEVSLSFPEEGLNFTSMAQRTLGRFGQTITFLSYLFLLYALVAAYSSGGGSLLAQLFLLGNVHIPPSVCSFFFVGILGSFVFQGIKAVDLFNRWLFSLKALFFVGSLLLLTPYIDLSSPLIHLSQFRYLWAGAPIFLCSFGYHILIPTLTQYLHRDHKRIRYVLIISTALTMCIYSYWLFELLGIISIDQFDSFLQAKGSTGEFVALISRAIQSRWVHWTINGFANVTITTSFLGVSMGLTDFLSDAFKRSKFVLGKHAILFLTFIPPLLFALFYPQGFVFALGYAAIFVAFSHVMLPALMVWQVRRALSSSTFRVMGGKPLIILVFLIGLALIILQILSPYLPYFAKRE